MLEGKSNLFETLRREKAAGRIKHFGVSIDTLEELKTVLKIPDIDTIEIMFNIIHQEPKYLFDEVKKRGILLIAKVPLDSGWLTGKYDESSKFTGIRERWSHETIRTRADIVSKIKGIVKTEKLVGPALAFIAGFETVGTIIPGIRNSKQLRNNIEAVDYKLSEDMIESLENLYDTYIKNLDTPWCIFFSFTIIFQLLKVEFSYNNMNGIYNFGYRFFFIERNEEKRGL